MILCDTDIFIEALKNNRRAVDLLREIGFDNIALSAITANKREMMKIKNRLEQLRIVHIDQGICEKAMNLVETYAKSHGLHIPDALIAATAIRQDIRR